MKWARGTLKWKDLHPGEKVYGPATDNPNDVYTIRDGKRYLVKGYPMKRRPKIENRSWDGRVMDVWPGSEGWVRFYLSKHEWFDVKIERGGVSVTSHPDPLILQPMMGNYVVARQSKKP